MSSRRDFLRTALTGSLGLVALRAIPSELVRKLDLVKLTVLHTNDVHSHIDPFPENDPKYPGLGGVARRAALIKKIRSEEKNVLLLDAGDIFQGTPYFNIYGGELEMKLMSDMGYHASTIGNHDLDNGIEGLVKQLPHANFPLICSNYEFSNTLLKDKTLPYKIFEFEGIKVGVFGLGIELNGLVMKQNYGDIVYKDPVPIAAYYAKLLREDFKCDLVICLSHLGYNYNSKKINDSDLGKMSKNIDLIIGGHTHTMLEKPSSFKNSDDKEIHVAQVGWAGLRLGRIDYYFERESKKKNSLGSTIKISK
jgi:5'-nucleotidase